MTFFLDDPFIRTGRRTLARVCGLVIKNLNAHIAKLNESSAPKNMLTACAMGWRSRAAVKCLVINSVSSMSRD